MSDLESGIYVFTGETFASAITDWVAEQIAAYPHRAELIRKTALAVRDFLDSEPVPRRRMIPIQGAQVTDGGAPAGTDRR